MTVHITMLTGSEGGEKRPWIVGPPISDPPIRLCACAKGMNVPDDVAAALQDPANARVLRGRTFAFAPAGKAKAAGSEAQKAPAAEPVATEPPNPTSSAAPSSAGRGVGGRQI